MQNEVSNPNSILNQSKSRKNNNINNNKKQPQQQSDLVQTTTTTPIKASSAIPPSVSLEETWNILQPRHDWNKFGAHIEFFEYAAKRLNVQKPEDWYQVTRSDIVRIGGVGLISNYYNNSFLKALQTIYPDTEWHPWLFKSGPGQGHWKIKENRKVYFDWLAKKIGITNPEDWYNVTKQTIIDNHGSGIISNHYNNSLLAALEDLYPQFKWLPWLFRGGAHRAYFQTKANRKLFFIWLAEKMEISSQEEWGRVTKDIVAKYGGASMLREHYNDSVFDALQSLFISETWMPWLVGALKRRDYWRVKGNRKKFLEWLARQLGFSQPEDWFNVTHEQIVSRGGYKLLERFDQDMSKILTDAFPRHASLWAQLSRFHPTLQGTASSVVEALKKFLDNLGHTLGVRGLDDWYRVSKLDIRQKSDDDYAYLRRHGGLVASLAKCYPHFQWDAKKFLYSSSTSSSSDGLGSKEHTIPQLRLMRYIPILFQNHEVYRHYVHPDIALTKIGALTTLDMYVPSANIGFKYMSGRLYRNILDSEETRKKLIKRDDRLRTLFSNVGVTLVLVPYWWNSKPQSLVATIRSIRPDLDLHTDWNQLRSAAASLSRYQSKKALQDLDQPASLEGAADSSHKQQQKSGSKRKTINPISAAPPKRIENLLLKRKQYAKKNNSRAKNKKLMERQQQEQQIEEI